jgi:hypothetical protein
VVDHQLLARVDALAPISLSTQAFRHVAHDRHPLSGAGARQVERPSTISQSILSRRMLHEMRTGALAARVPSCAAVMMAGVMSGG